MERYFWSLLAAVTVFVLGAGFSVFQGIDALLRPHRQSAFVFGLAVLGIGFVFDGASLARAVWQLHREATEESTSLRIRLLRGAEPAVRAVAFEDLVAVIGVLLAASGLILDHVFSSAVYDAAASITIGLLLIAVAYALGRQNQELLIGRAADDELLAGVRSEIESFGVIVRVVELMTMQLGPNEVLLAARVEVDPQTTGIDLATAADQIDERVQERFPQIRHVFLDPTPAHQPGDR